RFLIGVVAAVTVGFLVLQPGPIGAVIGQRLQSMGNVSQDVSFQARLSFYLNFGPVALSQLVGAGIGATGTATKLTTPGGDLGLFGNFDSGILEIPFVLGWF